MQQTSPSWSGWRRKWDTILTLSRRFEPKISLWHNNNNRNKRLQCSSFRVSQCFPSADLCWSSWGLCCLRAHTELMEAQDLHASVSLHLSDTNWPTKWRGSLWREGISASCIMPGRSPTALWVKETDTVTQHRLTDLLTDWLTDLPSALVPFQVSWTKTMTSYTET